MAHCRGTYYKHADAASLPQAAAHGQNILSTENHALDRLIASAAEYDKANDLRLEFTSKWA